MVITIQEIIDAITTGTRAEKEVLAGMVLQAEAFLNNTNQTNAEAQRVIDVGVAQTWFDDIVQPLIKWSNSQSLLVQRANILLDYELAKSLLITETDPFRREILNAKLQQANNKFKQIKAEL